jgi:predicted aspartyl protease
MSPRHAGVWLLSAMLSCEGAAAQDAPPAPPAPVCKLLRAAELDLVTEPNGLIAVPTLIDDHAVMLGVDTGDIHSILSSTVADTLHLDRAATGYTQELLGGAKTYQIAFSHSFKLGALSAEKFPFLVMPAQALEPNIGGLLGPDIMSNYDVDIDYAHAKFRLFSPDHCPGQVIYWTHDNYARVPMQLDRSWHITVPVTLDGKPLTAVVDTGAERSAMSLAVARDIFGIDEKNPALARRENAVLNGTAMTAVYRYPFASLTLEGVAVLHPDIDILPEGTYGKGNPQLLIGASVLRQLHIYIAYKEQMLYATAAEAK